MTRAMLYKITFSFDEMSYDTNLPFRDCSSSRFSKARSLSSRILIDSRLYRRDFARLTSASGSNFSLRALTHDARFFFFCRSRNTGRTSGDLLMLRLPRPTRQPRFSSGLRGKANKQELNLEGFIPAGRPGDFYAAPVRGANETEGEKKNYGR